MTIKKAGIFPSKAPHWNVVPFLLLMFQKSQTTTFWGCFLKPCKKFMVDKPLPTSIWSSYQVSADQLLGSLLLRLPNCFASPREVAPWYLSPHPNHPPTVETGAFVAAVVAAIAWMVDRLAWCWEVVGFNFKIVLEYCSQKNNKNIYFCYFAGDGL